MRRVRTRLLATLPTILLPATVLLPLGCTRSDPGPQQPATIRRVVSLAPSVTELIVALGAQAFLVGRTNYDSDPRLVNLPSVGGPSDPSVERLIELRPDLVIVWEEGEAAALVSTLGAFGIPARRLPTATLNELRSTVDSLGRWLGVAQRAESLLAALDHGLAAVRRDVAGRGPVSVFYVVWHEPLTTTGGGTYLDDLLRLAGGRNIFGDTRIPWPQVSLEAVLQRDPHVIVWPRERSGPRDTAVMSQAAGWREVSAVRQGRVHVVRADLFNRLGPNVVEAARTLVTILHPDATRDSRNSDLAP